MRKVPVDKALTLLATALVAVIAATLAGWLIDEVWLGEDLPRGVTVAEVSVARLSRAEALSRLGDAGLDQRLIQLEWAGRQAEASAAELGVTVDYHEALDGATDRGSIWTRPYGWLRSLFADSSHDPHYELDAEVLAEFFDAGEGSLFDLDLGHPRIELVRGEFTEVDVRMLPVVDAAALRSALLAAAAERSAQAARIEVPVAGSAAVDRGAEALIAEATALTQGGIRVRIANDYRSRRIPEAEVRKWIVFDHSGDEPSIALDDELVMSSLRSRFSDSVVQGEGVEFLVSPFTDRVYLSGGTASMACCESAAVGDILTALQAGADTVVVRPTEDPTAPGSLAWAESLGITELVGEFTTYFEPGQSRVANITRISDLTRGAIIGSGETFSVNDHVGRRTRADGFVAAGMISDGVFVNSVGGGISQYATTLFNAAFFAGLDFGEYQSHSIYLSRYPYGREATVSFPRPDLQIVNNTPYGILIWPTTTGHSITVKLFSTRWASGEQTGQSSVGVGRSCTKVTTERTRTFAEDRRTEVDYVTALYRPTGLRCDGSSSVPSSHNTTTSAAAADSVTTTTSSTPPSTTAAVSSATTSTTIVAGTTSTTADGPTTTTLPHATTVPSATVPAPTTTQDHDQ